MSDAMGVQVTGAAALIAALDRLGETVERFILPACLETANAIAREAQARVRRRTGHTAQQIRVEPMRDGVDTGFIVRANDPATRKHVESWLEFGTVHMTARPFLFPAARLENAAHDRRIRTAIEDAIAEEGLGA